MSNHDHDHTHDHTPTLSLNLNLLDDLLSRNRSAILRVKKEMAKEAGWLDCGINPESDHLIDYTSSLSLLTNLNAKLQALGVQRDTLLALREKLTEGEER